MPSEAPVTTAQEERGPNLRSCSLWVSKKLNWICRVSEERLRAYWCSGEYEEAKYQAKEAEELGAKEEKAGESENGGPGACVAQKA